MNGAEINGRLVRVEHSRRSQGHTKTPGRCKYYNSYISFIILNLLLFLTISIDLGPKGTSSRFNDRDRRGRYDHGYHNGGPRRRSNSRDRDRDRRPSYGGYRGGGRSRSKERFFLFIFFFYFSLFIIFPSNIFLILINIEYLMVVIVDGMVIEVMIQDQIAGLCLFFYFYILFIYFFNFDFYRGPPPPGDRWSGGGRRSRSRSRDRGPGGSSRPSYGGYDSRRDRR